MEEKSRDRNVNLNGDESNWKISRNLQQFCTIKSLRRLQNYTNNFINLITASCHDNGIIIRHRISHGSTDKRPEFHLPQKFSSLIKIHIYRYLVGFVVHRSFHLTTHSSTLEVLLIKFLAHYNIFSQMR